jgi:hypothetical protein
MDRVLVDDSFRMKLDEFRTRCELCDKHGHVLGVFIPAAERQKRLYEQARAHFSEEDLERRCQDTGGLTTAEVMKKLRDLEAQ